MNRIEASACRMKRMPSYLDDLALMKEGYLNEYEDYLSIDNDCLPEIGFLMVS
jgi:hypothetical protein